MTDKITGGDSSSGARGIFRLATHRWSLLGLVLLMTSLAVFLTIDHYGLTWDEPEYYRAAVGYVDWLKVLGTSLARADFSHPFQPEVIDRHFNQVYWWPMHPAFPRLVGGLCLAFLDGLFGTITAFRCTSLLFLLPLASCLYLWVARQLSPPLGLFAVLSLLLMPRFFAHTHFAALDLPIAAMWFLSAYTFCRGVQDRRWSLIWGITYGFALATKFHAFFIPVPLLVWGVLYHRRSLGGNLLYMCTISPVIFFLNQPYFFPNPPARFFRFVELALTRESFHPITTWYLGQPYYFSPPWTYSIVITAVTVPVLTLLLCAAGVLGGRRVVAKDFYGLVLINGAVPIALTMLPKAPAHDGARLFLPSLPFLAILAATGLRWFLDLLSRTVMSGIPGKRLVLATALSALFLGQPLIGMLRIHPLEAGYFNGLVGGVRGAKALGFETTYWGEALGPEVLDYMNASFKRNATVQCRNYYWPTLNAYQDFGALRKDIRVVEDLPADYIVLIWRQGFFTESDWALTTLDPLLSVEREGVRFLTIYDRESYRSILQ
jgi:hypothetical protein